MQILHIHSPSWPIGGAERYLESLCRLQQAQGHSITQILLCNPEESESVSEWALQTAVVAPRSWGIRSGLRCLPALMRLARKSHPDVIHLHQTHEALSPLILRALQRVAPTVLTLHDVRPICYWGTKVVRPSNQLCGSALGWECFRRGCYALTTGRQATGHLYWVVIMHLQLWAYRSLGRILVANGYLLGELVKNGFLPDRVTCLPLFTEGGGGAYPISLSMERRILYVGRLSWEKGVLQLMHSLDLIRDEEWRVEVVGTGAQLYEAEETAKRLGLNQRIRFVGVVPAHEVASYYRRCRVLAFPSVVVENFGLVGIEAMAFGRPVVAFDFRGVREWLIDGETGFLVKPGDIKAFALALQRLLRNPQLAMQMGQAGHDRVEKLFGPRMHLARLDGIYREVVGRRRQAGRMGQ